MNKKVLITLGAISVPVIAFSIGVSVAISKRKYDTLYKVKISNGNGSHYTVNKLNPISTKSEITKQGKDIWDIKNNENMKLAAAKYIFGANNNDTDLITSNIINGKSYNNGLEKLIFDLMNAKKNGKDLTLIFNTPIVKKNKAGEDIAINNVKLPNFIKKTKSERKKYLTNISDINKPEGKKGSVGNDLFELITKINIIEKNNSGGYNVVKTTTSIYNKALAIV